MIDNKNKEVINMLYKNYNFVYPIEKPKLPFSLLCDKKIYKTGDAKFFININRNKNKYNNRNRNNDNRNNNRNNRNNNRNIYEKKIEGGFNYLNIKKQKINIIY